MVRGPCFMCLATRARPLDLLKVKVAGFAVFFMDRGDHFLHEDLRLGAVDYFAAQLFFGRMQKVRDLIGDAARSQ